MKILNSWWYFNRKEFPIAWNNCFLWISVHSRNLKLSSSSFSFPRAFVPISPLTHPQYTSTNHPSLSRDMSSSYPVSTHSTGSGFHSALHRIHLSITMHYFSYCLSFCLSHGRSSVAMRRSSSRPYIHSISPSSGKGRFHIKSSPAASIGFRRPGLIVLST